MLFIFSIYWLPSSIWKKLFSLLPWAIFFYRLSRVYSCHLQELGLIWATQSLPRVEGYPWFSERNSYLCMSDFPSFATKVQRSYFTCGVTDPRLQIYDQSRGNTPRVAALSLLRLSPAAGGAIAHRHPECCQRQLEWVRMLFLEF